MYDLFKVNLCFEIHELMFSNLKDCSFIVIKNEFGMQRCPVDQHPQNIQKADELYDVVWFCFRVTFTKSISALLNIPDWRLFYIREEESRVQGCVTVKFGIMGNG